jgi:hypothetical protein
MDETKEEKILNTKKRDEIDLDPNKINFNPGVRSIAKSYSNSLWGKFGQNQNMTKTFYTTKKDEFYNTILDPKLYIIDLWFPTDEMVEIGYKKQSEVVEKSFNTNIMVAIFATAYARLELYDALD